ncbi:hypothetical protein TorRG33x02_118380 [Trema orientale]|uniref:Uncharacterized protein n=1 Tax=Trema orientale TaxID=63057 RepID=A0A2P5F3F7_TREOI|nr:hypothetical protein TorRG33x02_118380 [Trema orientale]
MSLSFLFSRGEHALFELQHLDPILQRGYLVLDLFLFSSVIPLLLLMFKTEEERPTQGARKADPRPHRFTPPDPAKGPVVVFNEPLASLSELGTFVLRSPHLPGKARHVCIKQQVEPKEEWSASPSSMPQKELACFWNLRLLWNLFSLSSSIQLVVYWQNQAGSHPLRTACLIHL